MIPSTLPQAAWWPLVGAALASLLGDRDDYQACRQAAIAALRAQGMPALPAMHSLTLHTWEAHETARALAVECAGWLAELTATYGTAPEPPMPREVCPDVIGHSGQPVRGEDGRPPIVQDRRRCGYCAGWISPGDLR